MHSLPTGTVTFLFTDIEGSTTLTHPGRGGGDRPRHLFLSVLGLAALTGLLTLVVRSTRAMGSLLTVHLGCVAALFLTMPYGKFVHFLYRYLALVKNRLEQGQRR